MLVALLALILVHLLPHQATKTVSVISPAPDRGGIAIGIKLAAVKQIAPLPQVSTSQLKPLQPIATVQTPTAPPAPASAPASTYSGSLAAWLLALRTCESGGNYTINTGNGFYGAYQFTIATWNAWATGYARADLAPASVQDATIIKNTNAASGGLATQNPGCYAKLGLSAYPPAN